MKPSPESHALLSRVQSLMGNAAVRLRGMYRNDPIVSSCAQISSDFIVSASTRRAAELLSVVNEPHGLLANSVNWSADPVTFSVQPIDYIELCVRRELSRESGSPPPQVLSANALVVCPEDRTVLLHRRARSSATYPGRLHTVGGAFWPRPAGEADPATTAHVADQSLRQTAMREVREETGLVLDIPLSVPLLLLEEIPTGFVQVAFLGCAVSAAACAAASGNEEGRLVWVPFDDLPDLLRRSEEWVPAGRASVLVWLGLESSV